MPMIYSIVETAAHPNFSALYQQLGLKEQRYSSMRRIMNAIKQQAPDFIVAEFIYGYSNHYAGINISNLDVLLYSLQKYAPDCRIIVFCNKEEAPLADKLQAIFPLYAILTKPAETTEIRRLLLP